MRILVLGSGAREHALAWKISQSSLCEKVYLHPGNAGTEQQGFSPLANKTLSKQATIIAAKELKIGLVVIGPEALLQEGYADAFRAEGIATVGPGQQGALLETSKVFAKEFMQRAAIPTAAFTVLASLKELETHLDRSYPIVLKYDGIAAGKGVVIAANREEALDFGKAVWEKQVFGKDNLKVVLEECIQGKEISYIGFCDGEKFIPLATATDYKRVFDNDEGPNTGGMGVVSPSPQFTPILKEKIDSQIIAPFLKTLSKENIAFRGILFLGIMVDKNQNPQVLEFNTRFGDPETEGVLLRLQSDLVSVLLATAKGTLSSHPELKWDSQTAVYVVGAAEGYPQSPKTGAVISGLQTLSSEATVFYSGVKVQDGKLVTGGGRVLGVGALGKDTATARNTAYTNLKKIQWQGMHFRNDIGK